MTIELNICTREQHIRSLHVSGNIENNYCFQRGSVTKLYKFLNIKDAFKKFN